MAESKRARVLGLGVAKLACDVDPSEERPTFTLLIINGAGEGLVSRGRFDAFRRAVAYLMKAGVPLPEPEFLYGPKPLRPGVGLSAKELEWRRQKMETFFDAAYRRFSERTKQHQAVLADTVLQFTFLRERDAAELEDLMSSRNNQPTSRLNEIDLSEEEEEELKRGGRRKVRFSLSTEEVLAAKEAPKMAPMKQSEPPSPRVVEFNARTLLLSDDARSTVVLDTIFFTTAEENAATASTREVLTRQKHSEPTYSLRVSIPKHSTALVSSNKPFSHFQRLQDLAVGLGIKDLPPFPTSPASQRLGFRLTPAQLEVRRCQLQTYCSCLVARFPEFTTIDQDTFVDAFDLTLNSWSDQHTQQLRADVREMIETDLDYDLMVRVERAPERDATRARSAPRRVNFFFGGASPVATTTQRVGGVLLARRAPRTGWWARLAQGADDDDDEQEIVDDAPGAEHDDDDDAMQKKKDLKKEKRFFSSSDPRLEDAEEPPWGKDEEVFESRGAVPSRAVEKAVAQKSVAAEVDDEERAARAAVLPKAIAVTKKLRRAELCLLVQIEGVTNLAKAVEGYASKVPRWYACAKVLEDGVVIEDPELIQRTPCRKEDDPQWQPFAPLLFSLPDAPDAQSWARRSLKFEIYDANLLPSITSGKTPVPSSGAHDLDHPAALVAQATVAGVTEFDFAFVDEDGFEEPTVTALSVDLVDADNRISNGAQLHTRICLTSSEIALEYAAVQVTSLVKYDAFVGQDPSPSYYSSLCSICVPSFLLPASNSTQAAMDFQRHRYNGASSSSLTVAPHFARKFGDDADWQLLGYFRASDFCHPLAETPTKFDLVREPNMNTAAPLDYDDERLLEDWHLRADLHVGYQYGPSAWKSSWSSVHTPSSSVRRSVWYRLAKKRQIGDDDLDEPIRVHKPEALDKKPPPVKRSLSTLRGNLQRNRSSARLSRGFSRKKLLHHSSGLADGRAADGRAADGRGADASA